MPYDHKFTGGELAYNEYVLYNPAHVQVRYIFRLNIQSVPW
jgi:hypothetical protein